MYAFSLALFLLTRTNVSFCASDTHVRSPIRTSTHLSELKGISPVAAWLKRHTLARSHHATLPLPPLPLQTHPSSGLPHKRRWPCTTPTPHTHLLCWSISCPLETYYRRHGSQWSNTKIWTGCRIYNTGFLLVAEFSGTNILITLPQKIYYASEVEMVHNEFEFVPAAKLRSLTTQFGK